VPRIEKTIRTLKDFGKRLGFRRDWYLIALAAVIGTVTAFGAIGFKWLLDQGERLGIGIQSSLSLWALPLLPMAGALATGLLVHFFAGEARGHGIPEVMDALYRKKAVIRPRVAVVKSVASACTIGSGGSGGAEGPIVQIGSAIGSAFSQALRVPRDQAATLLGCGAAAGIASVFNAPIAGVLFVLEILLRDFSLRTFTPIVVASVFSTATTQAALGRNEAIFAVSDDLAGYQFTYVELPSYLLLGILCGLISVAFTRFLYWSEDTYDKFKIHPVIKPVTGAFLLGLLGIGFLAVAHSAGGRGDIPPFFGNGYESIRELLMPRTFAGADGAEVAEIVESSGSVLIASFWMLMALAVLKATATCLTLASGGSGGVFAPSLFLGATSGAAFGIALQSLGMLPADGSPASYALVGMAAVLAGTTHAPLTAIMILYELTRDEFVLLPIMLAAVMAVVVAQLLMRDSIYSLKLRRRGVLIGSGTDLAVLRKVIAADITPGPFIPIFPDDPLSRVLELRDRYRITDFTICDHDNNYVGMVTSEDVRTALLEREAIPYLLVEELLRRDIPTVHPDETLDAVMEKFSKHEVNSLAMIDPNSESGKKVTGLITRARLMTRYQKAIAEA
jgi:CIC family chloride channel protein